MTPTGVRDHCIQFVAVHLMKTFWQLLKCVCWWMRYLAKYKTQTIQIIIHIEFGYKLIYFNINRLYLKNRNGSMFSGLHKVSFKSQALKVLLYQLSSFIFSFLHVFSCHCDIFCFYIFHRFPVIISPLWLKLASSILCLLDSKSDEWCMKHDLSWRSPPELEEERHRLRKHDTVLVRIISDSKLHRESECAKLLHGTLLRLFSGCCLYCQALIF